MRCPSSTLTDLIIPWEALRGPELPKLVSQGWPGVDKGQLVIIVALAWPFWSLCYILFFRLCHKIKILSMKKGRVLQNQAVSLCKILPAPLFQLIASGSLIYVLHFGKKSFLISFDSSTTFRIVLVFNFLKLIHQYLTKYALSGNIFLAGAMEVPCSREDS